MEITIGPDLGAHTIDLPSLHFRVEVLAEHLQTGDQSIAYVDVGHFERAVAPVDTGNQLFGRMRPDEFGALLRQGPDFARVFKTDTRDQVSDWNTVTGHHGAELVARCIPANMVPFEPGPNDGDIDIQIESEPRGLRQVGVRSHDPWKPCVLGRLAQTVFLKDPSDTCHLVWCGRLYINAWT